MKKALAFFVTIVLSVFWSFSQDSAGGIVYGEDWAYIIKAPSGWIMDSNTWSSRGIYALFYKQGTAFKAPNPIIYINSSGLGDTSTAALGDYIKQDVQSYTSDPNNTVTELTTFITHLKAEVRIFKFDIGHGKQYEMIGYLQQKNTVHMIILAVFSEKDMKENLSRLYEVIDSFSPMDKK